MRIVDARTGKSVPLRQLFGSGEGSYTVLSVKKASPGRARVAIVRGSPERMQHMVLPIRGWWLWQYVVVPEE